MARGEGGGLTNIRNDRRRKFERRGGVGRGSGVWREGGRKGKGIEKLVFRSVGGIPKRPLHLQGSCVRGQGGD